MCYQNRTTAKAIDTRRLYMRLKNSNRHEPLLEIKLRSAGCRPPPPRSPRAPCWAHQACERSPRWSRQLARNFYGEGCRGGATFSHRSGPPGVRGTRGYRITTITMMSTNAATARIGISVAVAARGSWHCSTEPCRCRRRAPAISSCCGACGAEERVADGLQ
jgi:hypothetical protein